MKHLSRLIASFLFFLMLSIPYAKAGGLNIFQHSREAPQSKILHPSGMEYALSDFNGDFVLAVFWERSCGPCIKDLKGLNEFSRQAKNKGIRVILISPDSDWKSWKEHKKFLAKYGAPDVEYFTDPKGKLAGDFGIYTSPHTVLIDENGMEIGRISGRAKWEDNRILDYIAKIKRENADR